MPARHRVVVVSIDGFAAFYWDDARARLPILRGLASGGAHAAGVETVFPSTTWPTHVSLVTGVSPGVHGVVANHVLNRATGDAEDLTGDPVYDAVDLLRVPTVYDVAHAAGRRTAAIDWPATRNARSLDFNLPFFKDQRVFETQTAPAVWEELRALGFPMDRQGEWAQLPKRFLKDAMVARVAAHVAERHAPDLLLLHFLCVDSLQHLHGPRSPEAYWALEYVDGLIGRVLATLGGETTVFVVSDHGFLPSAREIRPNVRLRALGAARQARFVMNHGAGALYGLDGDAAALAQLAREIERMEGVSGMWAAAEYGALGLPVPAHNALVADVMFEAAPGYSFGDTDAGEEEHGPPKYLGTHGQRGTYPDNRALFVAAGPAIRRGVELPVIRSRDVAPTIAAAVGVSLGTIEGVTLDAALG
ncbi:MAG TPA: ectonucleotide pyrophosphatase/phosphodiesterase [Terriglobales bacterium]|nr:ectonucleotide pyrophosphatase/phosphodiesterase [Terriglobales bacterium]